MSLRRNPTVLLWAVLSSLLVLPMHGAGAAGSKIAALGFGAEAAVQDAKAPRRIVRSNPPMAEAGGDGEVCARKVLAEARESLRLSSDHEFPLSRRVHTRSGQHFLFRQQHKGLPVLGGFLAVHLDRDGRLRLAVNEIRTGITCDRDPGSALGRNEALDAARARVGVSADRYHAPCEAALAIDGANDRLVWRVLLPADDPFGDWEVLLDAVTGEVLSVVDRVVRLTDGQGDIFDPNPVVTLQTQGLADMDDSPSAIPTGAYQNVTLPELNDPVGGLYYLRGRYCSLEDFELPMTVRATSANPDGFVYDRGDDRFEEVSVYYHVDAAQRRIRTLGFTDVLDRAIACDAHGLNGLDNSHYVPSTGRLAFGDGCVDDAEDAEVIWHEFGHAIQYDQLPDWSGTGEMGAMGEGFADFFAATLSAEVSNGYGEEQVFDWDRGPVDGCWSGRRVDSTKHYPEDMTGDVYADGEIWSAVLWQAAGGIGPDLALQIAIESHWLVPPGATFEDGAVAVLMADDLLFDGAHVPALLDLFEARGIVDPADFAPTLTHEPLASTEDPIGPYVVRVDVSSFAPVVPDSVRVNFHAGADPVASVTMTPTGTEGEYAFSLPGALFGTTYQYNFTARDAADLAARLPATPGTDFVFSVAQDATPPVVTHTAMEDAPFGTWPPTLVATVTDSYSVDSVSVDIRLNGIPGGSFAVPRIEGTDTYSMDFPLDVAEVGVGDLIEYRITASDASELRNTAYLPGVSSYYSFDVLNAAGRALVVNDTGSGGTPVLASDLGTAGFLVTTTTPSSLGSFILANYDFVGWASANNANPVSNATARQIIEDYTLGGGRVLIEGGEIGYDALKVPGYASFAQNVLHVTNWLTNYAGSVRPFPWKQVHPVLYEPNVMPSSIAINYAGLQANQDAVLPALDATLLAENTNWPGHAGILIHDDTSAPQSGQVVYFAFNIGAVTDANTRRGLVANAGRYLTAREGVATAGVSGRISLVGAPADLSGTLIRSLTDGTLAFTSATGDYVLEGLYATPLLLEVSHSGFETVQIVGVTPGEGGILTDVDAELRAVDTFSQRAAPYQSIPDNNPTGITSVLNCTVEGTVHDILVSVVIHHTYVGDLIVDLRSPSGQTVRLHNRTGKGDNNIITTFDSERIPDGPGALSDFLGQSMAGNWTLTVSDVVQVETGTLDSWTLQVMSLKPTQDVTGAPPARTRLRPAAPNPAGSSVLLSYDLASSERVRLAVYDLTGREIAVVDEGLRGAGVHEILWDGRDRAGRRASAGIYFYKLEAGRREESRKLVLLD